MINIAIIGAAGYTGGELIRLLLRHPAVGESRITAVSESHAGRPVASAHPDLAGETSLLFADDLAKAKEVSNADVIFLCQGHGKSKIWMQETSVAKTTIVIDLSIDHRSDSTWLYGLPELNREKLRSATRVANPGCFATTIELALLPLAGKIEGDVHVTALTGSTGAGQSPTDTTHYSWRANNVGVYKPFDHQHLPEISAVLGDTNIVLVPMRGSWTRGILASCVMQSDLSQEQALELYRRRYDGHPFTHIVDDIPDVKRVVGTNKCLIGIHKQGNHLLVVSVIDNLLKGASGQAIQNINLMYGFDETDGLLLKPSAY
ncbi:MAG: N-acetyl-gamma-glutamyl-phosphate reductase [bacterium]|nr:N-acetyl-gamma-glutamyl-phosphate reductase [bacterium]